jgi:hypothetical protein
MPNSAARLRLLPRQIAVLDQHRDLREFLVRYRWDGGIRLLPVPQRKPQGTYVLVLDPALPYRRRFRLTASQRYSPQLFSELASGLFPFPKETTRYALGLLADQHYLFALPEEELEELTAVFPRPPWAVLVAPASREALCRVLSLWIGQGRFYDLLGNPRPLPRSALLSVTLMGVLVGMTVLGGNHLLSRYGERQEQLRVYTTALQARAALTERKRQAIPRMNAAYQSLQNLRDAPAGQAQKLLETLLQQIPARVEIRSLRFEAQELYVTGWGNNPLDWLGTLREQVEIVTHEQLPERDYFELRFRL